MTAFEGPLIVYGSRNALGQGGSNNPNKSPSMFGQGAGLLDDRAGYNTARWGCIGFCGGIYTTINQTPQTLTATNIAGANTATAGTPLTLVTTANSGVTLVSSGGVTVWSSGTVIPANTLILDGLPGLIAPYQAVAQPSSGNTMVSLYDPTKAIARNVRITTTADDSGGFYTVAGYDLYGFPMTETITGVATAVASGKKAFKFISSITPSGTAAFNRRYGWNWRRVPASRSPGVNTVGFAEVWWANARSPPTSLRPFGFTASRLYVRRYDLAGHLDDRRSSRHDLHRYCRPVQRDPNSPSVCPTLEHRQRIRRCRCSLWSRSLRNFRIT